MTSKNDDAKMAVKGNNITNSARVSPLAAEIEGGNVNQSSMKACKDSKALPSQFTVGYALKAKKTESFIQPGLLSEIQKKGISFVPINIGVSLSEQGPFHVIMHKLSGKEWNQQLQDYQEKYPSSLVLDPLESIQKLRNRESMLQAVSDADFQRCGGNVGVPRQLVITGDQAEIPELVNREGLKLPLVVKPLVADGSAKSHDMYLAYDESCLATLKPPFVLQEFVNHGGLLYKVYVVGDIVRVVKRLSLPDVSEGDVQDGLASFARISCAAAAVDLAEEHGRAELPPQEFLEALACELRERLGLHLFNIDLIREGGTSDVYYVIDINYFPGYSKLPGYEEVFSDFLQTLAGKRGQSLTT